MGLRHSPAIRTMARAREAAEKLDGRRPKKSWGQEQLEKRGIMGVVSRLVGEGKTYQLVESAIKDPYAEERVEMYISAIRGLGGGSHVKGLLHALGVSKSKVWQRQRAVEHSVPSSTRALTIKFKLFERALESRLREKGRIDMHYLANESEMHGIKPEKALVILDRVKLKHRMKNPSK